MIGISFRITFVKGSVIDPIAVSIMGSMTGFLRIRKITKEKNADAKNFT
jgi:hypothetical protein